MRLSWLVWFGILGQFLSDRLRAEEFTSADFEFFEKQVRPLLVEKCHQCHSAKLQKGGLRLDSREAALKGGETGPAIKPGDVDDSLLVEAINYDPDGYQMPPTGKLAPDQIAVLTEWVRRKAPWPESLTESAAANSQFNLAERARHWSFQPIQAGVAPEIAHQDQASGPIDRFLLARLESENLLPAKLAEKGTQLRRLSFELTGLPPTIDELEEFQADANPDAYERVVDRLLASPRYGERWARHWLDLVRYAETYGHEFDFEIRFPHVYRDYLIRAFNADVPYDQFVREHVAGDLLPDPRREPAAGTVESVIGTAFWWFGQGKHSPVDIRAEECDTVDNQLDVFGKTFLGLTIACARCHDHKFDPITQRDYYALAGYLQSSRQTYADITPPERTKSLVDELRRNDEQHRAKIISSALDRLTPIADRFADLLLSRGDFKPEFLEAWHQRIRKEAENDRRHPLHLWVHWSADAKELNVQKQALHDALRVSVDDSAELASPIDAAAQGDPMQRWFAEGFALDLHPRDKLVWLTQASAERPLRGVVAPGTWIHSGLASTKLQGTLRSPTFVIEKPYIDFLAYRRGGSEKPVRGDYKAGQIHLIVDGFQIIKSPLYGHLSIHVAQRDSATWYRLDAARFLGSKVYLEIDDPDAGEIVIERIAFRDQGIPTLRFNEVISDALSAANISSVDEVAAVYQQTVQGLLKSLRKAEGEIALSADQFSAAADLVNWLLREEPAISAEISKVAVAAVDETFATRRASLEAAIPTPQHTLAMTAGSPENEFLLIRGNAKKLGGEVPRRFLEVFAGHDSETTRLELANRLADGTNPLVPRVIANRLWQHLFGRGLVSTPDDFGKMGQPPSHPELLDWLARELMRGDWSLKQMQRKMVASQAFRRSSRVEAQGLQPLGFLAKQRDPQNLLLHRANLQRLEAEAIRDSLLLISGRLDDRMFGAGVPPHLTEFMEGRGRPGVNGPLDGDGRRSLYIGVRRNFLTPLFLAFDFPTPFTAMGRRSTSNVPAQALTLMNNPLVAQQAELWVGQHDAGLTVPDRIGRLYQTAFGRPASPAEVEAAQNFLDAQAAEYGSANDPRGWNDLAHVLLNVKEFVFVE